MTTNNNQPYDAILLVAFGGPERMDEVMPFLENVLRGRRVPPERMREVAHHYELVGGASPLNAQNRALMASLEAELIAHGPRLPIYWGNRNWKPYLPDTLQQMAADGIERALAIFTTAYSSYSSCRQYRENVQAAQEVVGVKAPQIDKLRMFYNHPDFIAPNAELVRVALDQIPANRRAAARIAFTAHSIPTSMAENCRYESQLQEASRLVAEKIGHPHWRLVYQSRSGPPQMPWLEPDICDYIAQLHAEGVTDLVIAPIGFLSDHMEVIYDLDIEARELATELGMTMIRAATIGTHPTFIRMLRELIVERMNENPVRRAIGRFGPSHDVCPVNCCLPGSYGRPQPAGATGRPAAA